MFGLFGDGIQTQKIRIHAAYINRGHKIRLKAMVGFNYPSEEMYEENEWKQKEVSFDRTKCKIHWQDEAYGGFIQGDGSDEE